jgi:predicted MFS family arabinose efflux permease
LILTLINLFNYLDRYILPFLGETLRTSSLHISDTQFGILNSGFIVVYMLAAPLFGSSGDTASRPRLIALGVGIWSIATVLGGFAWSFVSLFVARALVGVGEAAYGTISPSLLADYYPRHTRSRVFGIFYAVVPLGAALGYLVAGQMDVHFGWRSAFFVAGAPGFLLALAALRLHDPPRGSQEGERHQALGRPAGRVAPYLALLKNRPYLLTVLGYAAYTFAMGAMVVFMPKFLLRVRGIPEGAASFRFSILLAVTGLGGTLVGGWLGDRLLRRTPHAYLWLSGLATLLAAPLAALALTAADPTVYWGATTGAIGLLFVSTGPVNSMIVNAVPPDMRATAVAGSILTIHVLGDVPSPTLLGVLSDRLAGGLAAAVLIIPVAVLLSGLIWTYAAWRASRSWPITAAAQ